MNLISRVFIMKNYLDLSQKEQEDLYKNYLQDPDAFYEKAEIDLLKEALQKTDKERFLTMTRLMKQSMMLTKAKIESSSPPPNLP